MVAGLEKSLAKQVEKGKLDRRATRPTIARPGHAPPPTWASWPTCDLVIESIVEDLAAKKDLFNELDRICTPATILATNTSTLPVIELAMETGRPDQVCGVHFFNPAPAMALVEIVRPITTADETIADGARVRRGVRQGRRSR